VQACPPSLGYRLKKLARRNKAVLVTAATVAAALVMAVVALSISNWWVARERDQKSQALRDKEAALFKERQALATAEDRRRAANVARANEAQQRKLADERAQLAQAQERLARRRFYAAQMNLALQAHESGNPARVLEILETQRPRYDDEDFRGFEWYYLWGQCHRGCRHLLDVPGQVTAVAFTRDGRDVVIGTAEGTVTLWDVDTGRLGASLPHESGSVARLVFSPDGKTLAVASRAEIRLVDWRAGKVLATLPAGGQVAGIAFFPSGQSLASSNYNGRLLAWDLATQTSQTITSVDRFAPSIAIAPDGRTMALGLAWSVQVGDWDGANWKELKTHKGLTHYVPTIAFSPDGKLLAAAAPAYSRDQYWSGVSGRELITGTVSADSQTTPQPAESPPRPGDAAYAGTHGVRVWEVETGQEMPAIRAKGSASYVQNIAFSPDGATLAVADGASVLFYDPRTGKPRAAEPFAPAHTSAISGLAYSPDGQLLVTVSRGDRVKIWDRAAVAPPEIMAPPGSGSPALSFTPDETTVVSGAPPKLWDPLTGQEKRPFEKPLVGTMKCPIARDGRLLVTHGPEAGVLHAFELATGKEVARLAPNHPTLYTAAISPDSRMVAAGVEHHDVKLWDVATQKPRLILNNETAVWSSAFSPDGRLYATGNMGGRVRLFDVATGQVANNIQMGTTWVNGLAFSADSQVLAMAGQNGVVRAWDVTKHQWSATFQGHAAPVVCCGFFADGQALISGGDDRTVKLWDLVTGQERFTLRGHASSVLGVAANAEGTMLASVSVDGTIRVWRGLRTPAALAPRNELDPDDPTGPLAALEEGNALREAGQDQQAAAAYQRARLRLEMLAARHDESAAYGRWLTYALLSLSLMAPQAGAETSPAQLRAQGLARFASLPVGDQRLAVGNLRLLYHGLYAAGRHNEAYAALHLAAELLPSEPENLFALAYYHGRTDDIEQTKAAYLRLLEIDPLNSPAWNNLGVAYDKLKRPEDALAAYTKSIELWPREARHWSNRGLILEQLNRFEEAYADFSRAIELQPESAKAWTFRGKIALKLKRTEQAIGDLTESLQREPDDADPWYLRRRAILASCACLRVCWQSPPWAAKNEEVPPTGICEPDAWHDGAIGAAGFVARRLCDERAPLCFRSRSRFRSIFEVGWREQPVNAARRPSPAGTTNQDRVTYPIAEQSP
jgi:WD40 repeat protein/regulator of sirC expression with transglutaminase-like and TPR domain